MQRLYHFGGKELLHFVYLRKLMARIILRGELGCS